MMQWYYAEGGKQVGPVSDADFQELLKSGRIVPKTLVWRAGMANWAAYETLYPAQPQPDAAVVPQEPDSGGNGNTLNPDLMAHARQALAGRWSLAVGFVAIQLFVVIAAAILPFGIGNVISFLISGSIALGVAMFFLALSRGEDAQIAMLFEGFRHFGTALLANFLMSLFILLWCLLLIIPGIIAAYSYSMTFYIIADDPSIGALEAIKRSKEMMNGMKWKFFCLNLRFLGWALLCILTLGIGILWLKPYVSTSCAKFYDDIRRRTTT